MGFQDSSILEKATLRKGGVSGEPIEGFQRPPMESLCDSSLDKLHILHISMCSHKSRATSWMPCLRPPQLHIQIHTYTHTPQPLPSF